MDRIPFDPYDFFGYLASGLLVLVGMDVVLGFPHILGRDFEVVDTALLVLAVYIAGQLIATPAKAALEDVIVGKILGPPSVNLFRDKKPRLRRLLFPGFFKALPEPIRTRILAKAASEGVSGTGEALFLHVRYHPSTKADEKLLAKLGEFLNKYGFARNLAFTCVVVGFALLIKSAVAYSPEVARYGYIALVVGALLFYRYLKFYRQYAYELFNSYGGKT
jgi:hypothetical protein